LGEKSFQPNNKNYFLLVIFIAISKIRICTKRTFNSVFYKTICVSQTVGQFVFMIELHFFALEELTILNFLNLLKKTFV